MNAKLDQSQLQLLVGAKDAGPRKYLQKITEAWPGSYFDLSTIEGRFGQKINRQESTLMEELHGLFSEPQGPLRVILTGTSAGDPPYNIDKTLISLGRQFEIPTVSVIETWNLFFERFTTSNGPIFPDFMIVNDARAKRLAISAGIPGSKILELGNPVFENLELSLEGNPARREAGKDLTKALFVSEEIRDSWISGIRGYDEFDCLEAVKSSLPESCVVTIKLHPEEEPSKYSYIEGRGFEIRKEMSFSEMVTIPDRIVGMESTLLYELSIFRDDVISLVPNTSSQSIFSSVPNICCVSNKDELLVALQNPSTSRRKGMDSWRGSTERIVKFLISVAS